MKPIDMLIRNWIIVATKQKQEIVSSLIHVKKLVTNFQSAIVSIEKLCSDKTLVPFRGDYHSDNIAKTENTSSN